MNQIKDLGIVKPWVGPGHRFMTVSQDVRDKVRKLLSGSCKVRDAETQLVHRDIMMGI